MDRDPGHPAGPGHAAPGLRRHHIPGDPASPILRRQWAGPGSRPVGRAARCELRSERGRYAPSLQADRALRRAQPGVHDPKRGDQARVQPRVQHRCAGGHAGLCDGQVHRRYDRERHVQDHCVRPRRECHSRDEPRGKGMGRNLAGRGARRQRATDHRNRTLAGRRSRADDGTRCAFCGAACRAALRDAFAHRGQPGSYPAPDPCGRRGGEPGGQHPGNAGGASRGQRQPPGLGPGRPDALHRRPRALHPQPRIAERA